MYIWILLATIMVAFSFYNIAPRSDKENVVSEIKAAIVIQRFKAEHIALVKTLECEMLYHSNNYSNPAQTIDRNLNVGYTSFQANLPIGYDMDVGGLTVYNKLFCLTGNIKEAETALAASCGASGDHYAVSFAQVPDRWIAKDDAAAVPLPAFVNFLAKEDRVGDHYGWVACEEGKCVLQGRNAAQRQTERVSPTSPIWNDGEFASVCRAGKPCLFSYKKLPTSDSGNHCQRVIDKHNNEL